MELRLSCINPSRYLDHFLWNYPQLVNVIIGSGDGLVPSGNKPVLEPMLTVREPFHLVAIVGGILVPWQVAKSIEDQAPVTRRWNLQVSKEVQWLDLKIGHQDSSCSNGIQGDMLYDIQITHHRYAIYVMVTISLFSATRMVRWLTNSKLVSSITRMVQCKVTAAEWSAMVSVSVAWWLKKKAF